MISGIEDILGKSKRPLSVSTLSDILKEDEKEVKMQLKDLIYRQLVFEDSSSRPKLYGLHGVHRTNKRVNRVSDFKEIKDVDKLVAYLSDYSNRLKNTDMLCQYTSLTAVVNIVKNKYWYLGSPKNMNDGLELQNGLRRENKLYFSSFMAEQKESIAMWSMYAQPWQDGVMISIPTSEFKKWVRGINMIYAANKDKTCDEESKFNLNKFSVSLTRVAYSNQDENGNVSSLSCGTAKNTIFKSVDDKSLRGYIKDEAWSYEKEVRLRIDFDEDENCYGVAIPITDELISSMVITKGPRFDGDLKESLDNIIKQRLKTGSSLFYDKLKHTPCDSCSYKND